MRRREFIALLGGAAALAARGARAAGGDAGDRIPLAHSRDRFASHCKRFRRGSERRWATSKAGTSRSSIAGPTALRSLASTRRRLVDAVDVIVAQRRRRSRRLPPRRHRDHPDRLLGVPTRSGSAWSPA